MQSSLHLRIPQIWADLILADVERGLVLYSEQAKAEQAEHEHRMATNPAYARAYELHKAEEEAESYWDALYDNWFPPEEEEDEW